MTTVGPFMTNWSRFRRRKYNPPLPSIVLGNTQSLRNKLDELKACTSYRYEFRDSCLMCFSETWFNDTNTTFDTSIDGFSSERLDRTAESGKSIGGDVCIYVNKNWCTNVSVVERLCSPDIELLTVGLRPHYLPREFNQIFVTTVYISPFAVADIASYKIAELINNLETRAPDAVKLVLGDFNHCELSNILPHYDQYVKVPTRKDKILDKCYGNIGKAYKAHGKAGLGLSDHNIIHLLPVYKQKLKQQKPTIVRTRKWTKENTATLRGCFECTDWDVFFGHNTIDEATCTKAVGDYLQFCEIWSFLRWNINFSLTTNHG